MSMDQHEPYAEDILANTEVVYPSLTHEIGLRLLRPDGPWKASGKRLFDEAGPKPYWAYAWGSGQALARYILDHPELVRGKRVFDFGAGSGVAAIAAARCGAAAVIANDIDPRALAAIECNAKLNGVSVATSGEDALHHGLDEIDVLLASDAFFHWPGNETVLYGPHQIELTLLAVPNRRGLAPGRDFPRKRLLELANFDVRTVPEIEIADIRKATVFQLLP